jgi:hypothetical protein
LASDLWRKSVEKPDFVERRFWRNVTISVYDKACARQCVEAPTSASREKCGKIGWRSIVTRLYRRSFPRAGLHPACKRPSSGAGFALHHILGTDYFIGCGVIGRSLSSSNGTP